MRPNRTESVLKGFTVLCCFIIGANATFANRLNITRTRQEQSNWCWAASTQMVLSKYGIQKEQTDIVTAIKGSPVNQTAQGYEIVRAIQWGGVSSSENQSALSEEETKSCADSGSPFVFGWLWSQGGGHALVYDGYEGNQYFVHDPWQNNGTSAHSYYSLTNAGGKGRWGLTITSSGSTDPDPDPWPIKK